MVRYVAIAFGLVMLAIGVLGFVPAATPDGLLFGIFAVDGMHNAVHIATGAIALLVGFTTERAARRLFQLFGVVYGIIAIAGFMAGDEAVFGMMAVNLADHILHAIIAVLSLAIGFAPSPNRRFVQPGSDVQVPRGV